jgi:hypothetical protein
MTFYSRVLFSSFFQLAKLGKCLSKIKKLLILDHHCKRTYRAFVPLTLIASVQSVLGAVLSRLVRLDFGREGRLARWCQSYLTLGMVLPCALALAGVPHRYVITWCKSYLTLCMVLPCALALAGVPHRYVITWCQSYLTLGMVLPCALALAGVPHRYVITRC